MSKIITKPEIRNLQNLEVQGLSCIKGFRELFSDISFSLGPGRILQATGANGAGKTSLLRIVAGLARAETGTIQYACDNEPSDIAYLGHKLGLKLDMSGTENLRFLEQLQLQNSIFTMQQCADYFCIDKIMHLPCVQLSAGQKQRLALCRILRSPCATWILDEPVTALDKKGIQLFENMLMLHCKAGGNALITSHQELNFGDTKFTVLELS